MNEHERAELARGIWTRAQLEPHDVLRLYRATASGYSMIGPGMPRAPVDLSA